MIRALIDFALRNRLLVLGGTLVLFAWGPIRYDLIAASLLAVATLLGVAVCAAYVPAMRAARTDPMIALRCE